MAAPVEQQPVHPAAELDAAVAQAIEACGEGKPRIPEGTEGAEAQGFEVSVENP